MNVIDRYYKRVSDILAEAFDEERENIEAKADDYATVAGRNAKYFFF